MRVVVTLLLLVAGVWNCALAGVLSQGLQRDVTSLLDTFPADAQSMDSQRLTRLRVTRDFPSLAVEHGPASVVQDWSLVCVQLCGAALGGDPCAPYCASVTVPVSVQKSNADILLSPNKDVICEDLCALKLGGSICACSSISTPRSLQNRNQVCQTFCINNVETLAGCSLCNMVRPLKDWTTDDAVVANIATTDRAKDTKIAIAPDAASPAITTSTTPDWDALCVSLCKTGDGGSLCNCDLSPFF